MGAACSGTKPYRSRSSYPPLYAGNVGNPPPPADLSVVTSSAHRCSTNVSASWADAHPEYAMPLANDRLEPDRSRAILLSIASRVGREPLPRSAS